MAHINLRRIANSPTFTKKGSLYELGDYISIEASRIEVLEPLTNYLLFEKDVRESNNTMDGTPTQIRTYSGYTCKVAESVGYIKNFIK